METEFLKFHHYNIQCKTLTPIHIGSGDTLASIGDYYVSSNRLFLIDHKKLDNLIDPINNKVFFDEYVARIKEQVSLSKSDFSIVTFLKEYGIQLDEITSENEIPIMTSDYAAHKNSQLKLACKLNRNLYFPGSSVKGVLKTVLFYQYLITNPDVIETWNKIIDESSVKKNYTKSWADQVEKDFLQFFKGEKSDFNLLRIEDTPAFRVDDAGIWEACRIHFYNKNEEMMEWLIEGVKSNINFDLHLTIVPNFNADFLETFNSLEITKLYSLINRFSLDQLNKEIIEISQSNLPVDIKKKITDNLERLKSFTKNYDQAILRIGAGKSFFYNTVANLLDTVHIEKLRKIAKIGKTEVSAFPLSRAFTSDHESLGWILLMKPKEKLIEIPDNKIDQMVVNETNLDVVYTGQKKVSFSINSSKMEVQLALAPHQKELILNKGDIVRVYIKQMAKDGRITMVGIK